MRIGSPEAFCQDDLGVAAAYQDVQCCAEHLKESKFRAPAVWKAVVVTGATGHIGAAFVELLAARGVKVFPIARSLGHDISKPRLGMDPDAYDLVLDEADAVIHCAAVVNWSAPYSELRQTNVLSMLNIAKLCTEKTTKAVLFIGSGAAFPEEAACVEWLQQCVTPYMVSKIAAELLLQKLLPHAVVVRPGLVVWHSQTGAHRASDAYAVLVESMRASHVAWREDDLMDGMNVDTFCRAAYAVFEHGLADTYAMHGCYNLSEILQRLPESMERVPYQAWRERIRRMPQPSAVTALLPHLDATSPPFAGDDLSVKCQGVLGAELALQLTQVAGYDAFVKALEKGRDSTFSSISFRTFVYFPLLVLRGSYHYWKHAYVFQWTSANGKKEEDPKPHGSQAGQTSCFHRKG